MLDRSGGARGGELSQRDLVPFYLGVLSGPMGSGPVIVLFVVLMDAFGVGRGALSLAVTAYMIPFATVQLISGGISDLTSRRSSLLGGFGAFGAATIFAGLAPSFGLFLLAQALQGAANAFTTPLVLATLGDITHGRQLSRAVGLFSTANIAGFLAAPLVAGFLGGISWRAPYLAVGLYTWAFAAWYWFWFRRHGASVPPRPRSGSLGADSRRILRALGLTVALLAAISFCYSVATRGASYLFADYLQHRWGSSVEAAGVILATFGLGGLLLGPLSGDVITRIGLYRGAALSMLGVALSLILLALAPSPLAFAGANLLYGVAAVYAWTALNMLVVEAVPAHRGTVSSIFGAARFYAMGVAPLWFTPLYQSLGARSIYPISAVFALALLPPLLRLRGHHARVIPGATADDLARR